MHRGALCFAWGRLIFGDLDFPVGYMRVIYTVGPQTPLHTRKGPRYHTRCPRDLSSSASVGRLAVLLTSAGRLGGVPDDAEDRSPTLCSIRQIASTHSGEFVETVYMRVGAVSQAHSEHPRNQRASTALEGG